MSLSPEDRELIAQEFGYCMGQQTKHLIEAMECSCCDQFDKVDGDYIGEKICKRCEKLKELKGD